MFSCMCCFIKKKFLFTCSVEAWYYITILIVSLSVCVVLYKETREVTRLQREVTRCLVKQVTGRGQRHNTTKEVTRCLVKQVTGRGQRHNTTREVTRLQLWYVRMWCFCLSVCNFKSRDFYVASADLYVKFICHEMFVCKLYASLLLYIKYWDRKY